MNVKFYFFIIITFFVSLIFLLSCSRPERHYESSYEVVKMSRTDFENAVKITSPVKMKKAGKIYIKDNYLFIGDTNSGFHIYDNSNPEKPISIAFLEMPGVTDIAIRNDVFYANQAVDLIAFKLDIDKKQVQILKRIKNTFPELESPDRFDGYVKDDEVIVDWNEKGKSDEKN